MSTPAQIIFCNICDKATYPSGIKYHHENPCSNYRSGYDCMCMEDDDIFCRCGVK